MNKITNKKISTKIQDIAKLITVLTYATVLTYVSYFAYTGNLFVHI